MILSDRALAALWPEYRGSIEPASIDLRLGDSLRAWPSTERRDPRTDQADLWRPVPLRDLDGPVWVLRPHLRYLATSAESIRIPDDHVAQIAARSSWGRDGLAVICGPAGYIDPGFHGLIVLELSVIGSELVIWPGASIAQIILHTLSTPAERPYGHHSRQSKYQDTNGIVPSKTHLEARP